MSESIGIQVNFVTTCTWFAIGPKTYAIEEPNEPGLITAINIIEL